MQSAHWLETLCQRHLSCRSSDETTKYDYDRYIWLVDQGRKCNWDESWLKKNGTFQVADPAMNFILLRANRDLRHLAVSLGEDTDELDSWISYQEQGIRRLWTRKP